MLNLKQILLITILLRIIWIVVVPVMPVSDSHAYDVFAWNLANGHGYGWNAGSLTAYWPVGTSFVYSLFYRLFGHTYFPIIILNLLLSILIVWLLMRLAGLWFNPSIMLLAGLLYSLWPSQIQFVTVLSSELLFITLNLILLVVWFDKNLHLWMKIFLGGLVLAVACYVRPVALLLPFVLLFIQWVETGKILKTLGIALFLYGLIALLIAPWSIRNSQMYNQFVLISTNAGMNFWLGNNREDGHVLSPTLKEKFAEMNEAERDSYLRHITVAYIQEEPFRFIIRTIRKVCELHKHETIGVHWNKKGLTMCCGDKILWPMKLVSQSYWLLVLGFALVGVAVLGKQYGWMKMMVHPLVLFWVYFSLIYAIFVVQDRYHFSSIPSISILAALGMYNAFRMVKKIP